MSEQALAVLRLGAELLALVRDRLLSAAQRGIAYEAAANEALVILEGLMDVEPRDLGASALLLEIAIELLLETPLGAPPEALYKRYRERGVALREEARQRESDAR
jgi:hypothetical protein